MEGERGEAEHHHTKAGLTLRYPLIVCTDPNSTHFVCSDIRYKPLCGGGKHEAKKSQTTTAYLRIIKGSEAPMKSWKESAVELCSARNF
jgi:hypothetical protein